ncbi:MULTISPECIES: IclR family transcriptional regulator [unclassified Streptomyces]|uniref:IclR family transcriptional regulator n=1 Tax=unclassified Streptomyces TaxID=2593676 RepID=UPI000AE26DBA|nr:IclR family transcriptional regulator [Streptomyces sp. CNQ-509]
MSEGRERTPGVDSARRVLKILLLFTEKGPELSVEEIAHSVGISVPSAYRFVSLLREMDMVEDNGGGTYVLSPRIFLLARSAEQAFPVSKVLRPLVERLSKDTGEAALVIRRVGDFATCVEMSQPEHTIRLSFEPGQIMSLHRGAGPKVLLAAMGEAWAQRYFDRLRPAPSAAERDAVLAEVQGVAAQGWSKSEAEVDEGVWAVAAPIGVGEKVVAAVTVAGPHFRIDDERAGHITERVVAAAAELSDSLSTWRR